MKVVVTGAAGQLGQELVRTLPQGCDAVFLDRATLDIGDKMSVLGMISNERPDVVINAAAYTAVDKAESDVRLAERVNVEGPANLAAAPGTFRLLHVSTDFVFEGSQSTPRAPSDPTKPLSIYGSTKLAGEGPVLALGHRGLVLRSSWVYSKFGHNFVKTMLRLMDSRPEVRVVADQVGAPTWARGLADTLWTIAAKPGLNGLRHWSDAGAATWYDFAVAIAEEGLHNGLLEKPVRVVPIRTRDYPTPARRPAYSLMDCSQTWNDVEHAPPHWRVNLRRMLQELKVTDG